MRSIVQFIGVIVKAQLSLEFMLYTALVAASTVSALSIFIYAQCSQNARASSAYAEELFALINANMAYERGYFYAVVPAGLCNASLHGNEVDTKDGVFRTDGNLTILRSACTMPGSMERLELVRLFNGTYVLEGAGQ